VLDKVWWPHFRTFLFVASGEPFSGLTFYGGCGRDVGFPADSRVSTLMVISWGGGCRSGYTPLMSLVGKCLSVASCFESFYVAKVIRI
jgi:hypothetical protein